MEPKNLLFYLIKRNSDGLYLMDSSMCTFGKFCLGHTVAPRTTEEAAMCIDRVVKRRGLNPSDLSIVPVGIISQSTQEVK